MDDAPDGTEIEALASLHDGLGHPVRVATLFALRKSKRMTLAELRRAVSELYAPLDTRRMQFHLYKMQVAGLVDVRKEGGSDVVSLRRDVVVRVKEQAE